MAYRAFSNWVSVPITRHPSVRVISEARSVEFIWRELTRFVDVQSDGLSLFTGSLTDQRRAWREFCGYIHQARTYFEAASLISGASAALLYYYSFLNLAKAELLIASPSEILGRRLQHGLVHNPASSRSALSDVIVVQDGVFRKLYEKRCGTQLPRGERLQVKRLLLQCREVGLELGYMGWVSEVRPILHLGVTDRQRVWSVIAVPDFDESRLGMTARILRRHMRPVKPDRGLWDAFNLTTRFGIPDHAFYESDATHRLPPSPRDELSIDQLWPAGPRLHSLLREVLDDSFDEYADGVLCPSLFKSRICTMPGTLSRYALMFYVSSLVRYKPSHLDRSQKSAEAWLFDAFTPQAAPLLLHDFLNGISGMLYQFIPITGLRR